MSLYHVKESRFGFGSEVGWFILCDSCGMQSDAYDTRSEAKDDADAVGHLCAECSR